MATELLGVDIEALVRTYGYAAIILGTVFEGEATMLAAGAAAHRGLLSPSLVVGAGMLGTFISDTFCFGAGRYGGRWLGRVFPRTMARIEAAFQMMARYQDQLIIWHQFIPGMCTITPLAFGMSGIRTSRFLALNLTGNCLWTITYTIAGYGVAAAWHRFPGWAGSAGTEAAIAMVVLFWIFRRPLRSLWQRRSDSTPGL